MNHILRCSSCGREYEPAQDRLLCDSCPTTIVRGSFVHSGLLVATYDIGRLKRSVRRSSLERAGAGIWRYGCLLPDTSGLGSGSGERRPVSLGEGDTPLLDGARLGQALALTHLHIKQESLNPTGAFKDRESAVVVTIARELGARSVSCASTGSMAASLAAYAARGRVDAHIFVPASAPPAKMIAAVLADADIVPVNGIYEDALRLQAETSQDLGWYDCSSATNPYRIEGDKTIAMDICRQLGWRSPDCVIVPTGSGGNLFGEWKGFCELYELGLIDALPRMVSVGTAAGAPLAQAYAAGTDELPVLELSSTIAGGLLSACLDYGRLAYGAVRDSNGYATALADDELLHGQAMLARLTGVFAEPSGAAAIAALPELLSKGVIDRDDVVVAVVTGSGFREVDVVAKTLPELPVARACSPTAN